MNEKERDAENIQNMSRYLSYLLRHDPAAAGIALDRNGWAKVDELLAGVCAKGRVLNFETLVTIVENDQKHRYSFNEDRTMIRANQGHSVAVDLEMKQLPPPDVLYHGTAEKYLPSIREKGILKRSRNYVHLSMDAETARKVGARHGVPVVLVIDAAQMAQDGFLFILSENGVWQTEEVPFRYVKEEMRP